MSQNCQNTIKKGNYMPSFIYISGSLVGKVTEYEKQKTTIIVVEYQSSFGGNVKMPVILRFEPRRKFKAITYTGAENIHCEVWGDLFVNQGKVYVTPFKAIFTDLTKATRELVKNVTPKQTYRRKRKNV